MKFKITVIAAMFIFSMQVNAEKSTHEICSDASEGAEKIMKLRQQGYSMRKLMEEFQDNDFGKAIVQDAYDQPRYNTDEYQQKIIKKFSNEIYSLCIKKSS